MLNSFGTHCRFLSCTNTYGRPHSFTSSRCETGRPVKNIHEFVFTVGHTEVHDSVQQVDEISREITVKC